MRNKPIQKIFQILCVVVLLAGCGQFGNRSASPSPTATGTVRRAAAPPPPSSASTPTMIPLPKLDPVADPDCPSCPPITPGDPKIIGEQEFREILKTDPDYLDLFTYATELGYTKNIGAAIVEFSNGIKYIGGFAYSDKDIIYILRAGNEKVSKSILLQFYDVEVKDEKLVSGKAKFFNRQERGVIDILEKKVLEDSFHHSCSWFHCMYACGWIVEDFFDFLEALAQMTTLFLVIVVAASPPAWVIEVTGTVAAAGGLIAYCTTYCTINSCRFCRNDNCGDDDVILENYCSAGKLVSSYRHYYCQNPDDFYNCYCQWVAQTQVVQTCPQACSGNACVTWTWTPTRSATITRTPTITNTAPTSTRTATSSKTITPTRTYTLTRSPTATHTITPTKTPTNTRTPTRTPTDTPSPTPRLGINLSGYVGDKSGNPVKDVNIHVYFEEEGFVRHVAKTDGSGYYYKIWVPYDKRSTVYVFASLNEYDHLPSETEFIPIHKWYHEVREETKELNFGQ
ncbi:MAG TPA: carboxypeptidase-like regulatory domain-containing protein [Anaerolineaceae bacterium]